MAHSLQHLVLMGVLSALAISHPAVVLQAKSDGGRGPSHFVLVHGLGHGAWCWYKITTLLQQAGHRVTAIDLASNGINKAIADNITSLSQYAQPLTHYLAEEIRPPQKVILVGHSLGGGVISYAMELYPEKIEVAFFVAAVMPTNNQTSIPPELLSAFEAAIQEGVFIPNFGNGVSKPATSYSVNNTFVRDFFYNESPLQDITLAKSLLNPTPSRPLFETLTLTPSRYGSIKRVYIRTGLDQAILPSFQSSFIQQNPPEKVLVIKNSDHSPFFSTPFVLTSLLVYENPQSVSIK